MEAILRLFVLLPTAVMESWMSSSVEHGKLEGLLEISTTVLYPSLTDGEITRHASQSVNASH